LNFFYFSILEAVDKVNVKGFLSKCSLPKDNSPNSFCGKKKNKKYLTPTPIKARVIPAG